MSRRRKLPKAPVAATIKSLSHEGRGIVHVNDKVIFIEGALPGEEVRFQYRRRQARYDEGQLVEVLKTSNERITPGCRHFDICGGCSLQHLPVDRQLQHKQSVLLELLDRTSKVQPQDILDPLTGPVWGYRRRARLSAKYVDKKENMLVGFREKHSSFVAELSRCEILHPPVGELLEPLQDLLAGLSVYRHVPQIEVAVADKVTTLVVRHLAAFTEDDLTHLRNFAEKHGIEFYLQAAGPESIMPLEPESVTPLSYRLSDYGLEFFFQPTDFIQNNTEINRLMVKQAIKLLSPEKKDRVLDLFCGLGNFSLPLAQQSGYVCGVEGNLELVERARENAQHNKIENIEFHNANLADDSLEAAFIHQDYQKVLLDPPRTGAREILQQLKLKNVDRLVYISCNPATLARDAGILVHDKGYKLKCAGVIDMFPHTTHLESIALFEY